MNQLSPTLAKGTTVKEFLQSFGIRTSQDVYAYLAKNAKVSLYESRYDIMVRMWGATIADKVVRLVEVASWWASDPMLTVKRIQLPKKKSDVI